MGTKHTPGPWKLDRSLQPADGEYDYAISSPEHFVLAEAFGRSANGGHPPAEANARLIAAAPELLEALREAEVGLEFAGADKTIAEGDFIPTPTLALRAVRAAIAKATGGQS